MKRSEFLRSIFGITALAVIPTQLQARSNDIVYSFDELFQFPYNNDRLIYMKPNSDIYKTIKKSINSDRLLGSKHFSYYLSLYDLVLPVKETYTLSDFTPFILSLNSRYRKNITFIEYEQNVFFRLIDNNDGLMNFDLFVTHSK